MASIMSKKLINAKKNVVVINFTKNEQLDTDDLVWDQRRKRIYSEANVKITRPTDILYGSGFDADEQFIQYEVFKSKGEMEIEEERK